MIALKAIHIIQSFSPQEKNKFYKFLNSPFFNTQKILIYWYDFFAQNSHNFTQIPASEQVWEYIHRADNETVIPKYNETKYRRICSDISALAEQFLGYQHYQKHQLITQQANLLKEIGNRNLSKLYHTAIKQLQNELNAPEAPLCTNLYYENYLAETQKFAIAEKKTAYRTEKVNINDIIQQLDIFYILEKLKWYCELLNQQQVLQNTQPTDLQEINSLLQMANTHPFLTTHPAFAIYSTTIQAFMKPKDESLFYNLKTLLEQHANQFDLNDASVMFNFALNYCIKKINAGKSEFLHQLFELYKQALYKKILFENKILSPWHYKNIVSVGLRIGELQWVYSFIQKYKENLPDSFRENAYVYNRAKYFFYTKNYDEVISLLQTVEYEDVFYSLDSKTMLLKVYYEQNEGYAFDLLVESFAKLLQRKTEISETHKINYNNLIRFTKRLMNISHKNKPALNDLKNTVTQTPQLADINWLLNKINEKIASY